MIPVRIAPLLAVAACGRGSQPDTVASGSAAPPPTESAELACAPEPFADSTPVPEASGAAWLTIDGKLVLVVAGDSGNDGAYGLVDPDDGKTLETGKLPLGDAGDDLEGLAARGGKLYGLISSGWMLVWERRGGAFALVDGPYAIGDDSDTCGKTKSNCKRNFEGLCLPAQGPGFAASKTDGALYPLVERDGRFALSHDHPIAITGGGRPPNGGALADCAFDDRDRLWAASNLFDLGHVYRVDGWRDPATAKVVQIGALGVGFPEVIAARGDVLYRMSDLGGAPSLMAKFRCSAKGR
jgi:hypothetical protein